MKLELRKTPTGSYKLISESNNKNEALELIAELLKESNKTSDIKIGVYSIFGGEFTPFKSVYSYISKRTDKMNKKNFYEFLKGKRQIKQEKNTNAWKPVKEFDANKELENIL